MSHDAELPPGLHLELEEPTTVESQRALKDAMVAYQTELYGESAYTTVGLFLRDPMGALQAGLSGRLRWGWLFVEMLWVADSRRGQGLGSRLLRQAEEIARERGGVAVHLDSGGVRALPFYEKHGYEVVGATEGFPPGSSHHHLRKWLVPPKR